MRKTSLFVGVALAAFVPGLALAAQIGVLMSDNYYGTKDVSISQGDTVTWYNYGSASHTVTSDNGYFDSQSVPAGQSYQYVFNVPGIYKYHDTYYGGSGGTGMSGTVTVLASSQSSTPTNTVQNVDPTLTTSQLQAQTEALLILARAKQQQPASASASCPTISRALSLGKTGDDVSQLQTFLAKDADVYPEGLVTGYYGSLTVAAVQRWQAKFGVVSSGDPASTGYGAVGPKTRAAIAEACTNGGQTPKDAAVGGFIKVTPVAGKTPMNVQVILTINTSGSCDSGTYMLDFGDDSSPLPFTSTAGICQPQSITLTHVYQWGGSYPITLTAGTHKSSTSVVAVGPPNPNTPSVGKAATGTASTGAVATVNITDSSFTPGVFTVPPGTQIVWTNNGNLQHSVTADGGSFDSGIIAPGKTFSSVFSTEGTFPYYCKFHGAQGGIGMSGIVVVSKTAKAPTSSTSNTASTGTNNQSTPNGTMTDNVTDTSGKTSLYTQPEAQFSAGHTVTLTFNQKNACDTYSLDWGDGTNTILKSQGYTGCTPEGVATVKHVFKSAGTYSVILSRGVGYLHTDTMTIVTN